MFFISTRNSWGLLFFSFCVWHWLVGWAVKSTEIAPGWGMLLAEDHPCGIFQSCLFASEGYPGGLRCSPNWLWLLGWSWGCSLGRKGSAAQTEVWEHLELGFYLLRWGSERGWARSRSSSGLGCAAREKWEQPKGHRGTPELPQPQALPAPSVCAGPAIPEEKSWQHSSFFLASLLLCHLEGARQ